ncbi:MAG: ArsR family transcriptional regulator [Chloroflexi bacterium RBG_16_54_18]|nr:MAG: ArsR family transcriptional regulator [Chloroflexi bacterium RBG_16_54_18]
MDAPSTSEELLNFFKALADANRLKIVGLLAQQPTTVEGLAEALGLGASTVSHHLSKLARAGLVSARTDGHYYIYSLQTDALRAMAQRLLSAEELPRLSEDADLDAGDRKVLANFLDADGRIKAFPAQEKKFQAILRHVVKAFEPGQRYTEKQVNEILARYNKDTAYLRRGLVDYRLMARQGGGGEYWRIEA